MRRYGLAVISVVLFAIAGCQAVPPQAGFQPLCTHRAYDSGRCDLPSDLHLFGVIIGDRS